MSNIHKNDVGTVFKCRIVDDDTGAAIDVSTATVKNIIFKKPYGAVVTKAAVFTVDGSDGYIQYATLDGDLDITGEWSYQGYVEDGTYKNSSEIKEFTVEKNLTPDA